MVSGESKLRGGYYFFEEHFYESVQFFVYLHSLFTNVFFFNSFIFFGSTRCTMFAMCNNVQESHRYCVRFLCFVALCFFSFLCFLAD